jgi:hypothetical protein
MSALCTCGLRDDGKRRHTGTATLIPICPGSACNSNFLAAAPLLVFCQYRWYVRDMKTHKESSSISTTLSATPSQRNGWTYYLLALMISIASSIVSAATILKTGPKISFLSSALHTRVKSGPTCKHPYRS